MLNTSGRGDTPYTPTEQTHGGEGYFRLYLHALASELEDILTDVDEPGAGAKTRLYTVAFTPPFDQLLLLVYLHILTLPTTTPFTGIVPPLGLVSRVASEVLHRLRRDAGDETVWDTHRVFDAERLRSASFQPVCLQFIRKRLLDLCLLQKLSQPLPAMTLVLVAVPAAPSRQLLIANLPLDASRLRLLLLNLRIHSLTRNNLHLGLLWLHVGNMQKPQLGLHQDASTELLQLMADCVPLVFLRSQSAQLPLAGFNAMMLDYQTPPLLTKLLFSALPLLQDDRLPRPLTINVDTANTANCGLELNSPFLLATTPQEDFGYFSEGLPGRAPLLELPLREGARIAVPSQFSLLEKKRDSLKMKRGIH